MQRLNNNKVFVSVFLLVLGGAASLSSEIPSPQAKTVVLSTDLQNGSTAILGELGLPLGTPVEVEGVLLGPKKTTSIPFPDEIRFAVDVVGGKRLESPKEFSFRVENPTMSKIQNSEFGLKSTLDFFVGNNEMTREQADKMFADYAKVRRKLLVYESATYVGRPPNLPNQLPARAEPLFGFSSYLVVVTPKYIPPTEVVVFDKPQIELALPVDVNEGSVSFPFRNTSSNSVKIFNVRTACDCIQSSAPEQEIGAGKIGEIKLNFRSKLRNGADLLRAVVAFNNDEFHEIAVSVKLRSLIEVQPLTLRWMKGEKRDAKEFIISSTGLAKLQFAKVTAVKDSKLAVLRDSDPATIRVRVTPPAGDRPFQDILVVSAELEGTGETKVYDLHVRAE